MSPQMVIRQPHITSLPSFLLPCFSKSQQPLRYLHRKAQVAASHIPPPTPFVPDSKTFLALIGRNLTQHAAKIPTWPDLFSYTSQQLRKAGVEPARTRRYLLWWRDRYRKGIHGTGGDLEHVVDGAAKLQVVEVPIPEDMIPGTNIQRTKKFVVNVPPDASGKDLQVEQLRPVGGMKIVGERTIAGPYIQPVKGTRGSVAIMKVQDGMWEERRGVKVDGGERRKAMVRFNRKGEELKKNKK